MKMTPRERAAEAVKLHDDKGKNDSMLLPVDLEERIAFQINEAVLEEREANFKFVAAAARNERPAEKYYDRVECKACYGAGRGVALSFQGLQGIQGTDEQSLIFKSAQGICLACNGRGYQRELRCSK